MPRLLEIKEMDVLMGLQSFQAKQNFVAKTGYNKPKRANFEKIKTLNACHGRYVKEVYFNGNKK